MTQDDGSLTWQTIEPPADEAAVRARHAANREAWNQGAVQYTETLADQIAFIRAGKSNLHPIERANLGRLADWCHTAIHLQCASGKDTLSLWNEGVAAVVGVDISDTHIENACRMSAAVGAPARWYRCDVLDTPAELDGSADLVYTGRGALCWLQDLSAWAHVVFRLLKPGGTFHVLDDHPAGWLFDFDAAELKPSTIDYFGHAEWSKGWGPTYIGDLGLTDAQLARKYERLWTLADIFQALTGAGLIVDLVGEYPDEYWVAFPNLPDDLKRRIPMTFAMRARRPG